MSTSSEQNREIKYEDIDSEMIKQKSAVEFFVKVDQERRAAMEAHLPGGIARTHAGRFTIDRAAE